MPYFKPDDFRLEVCNESCCTLVNFYIIQYLREFLAYLDNWKESVHKRPGFDKKEKQVMVLPHETVDGIHITGMSILLSNPSCAYYFYILY